MRRAGQRGSKLQLAGRILPTASTPSGAAAASFSIINIIITLGSCLLLKYFKAP
jgi:hypothetical protein